MRESLAYHSAPTVELSEQSVLSQARLANTGRGYSLPQLCTEMLPVVRLVDHNSATLARYTGLRAVLPPLWQRESQSRQPGHRCAASPDSCFPLSLPTVCR